MGYVLLWIEHLAVSLLMMATLFACVGRIRRRWLRWTIWIPVLVAVLLIYLAAIITFGVAEFGKSWTIGLFWSVLWLTVFFIIGVVWLIILGQRKTVENHGSIAAATWPRGKLALAFVVALALHIMTLWNMDLAARQQLAALRAEAGALALSVAPPRVPDADNAAVLYEQAVQALDAAIGKMPKEAVTRNSTDGSEITYTMTPWVKWSESLDQPDFNPQDPDLVSFLRQQSGTVSLLLEAAKKPGCYFEHDYGQPSIMMLVPELMTARQNARLLAIDARHKAAAGDLRAAMRDINAMFVIAEHASTGPLLVSSLVGCAIDGIAANALQAILASYNVRAEDLDAININPAASYYRIAQRAIRYEEAMRWNELYEIGETHGISGVFSLVQSLSGMSGSGSASATEHLAECLPFRLFLLNNEIESQRWYSDRAKALAAEPYHKATPGIAELVRNITKVRPSFSVSVFFPAMGSYMEAMARGDAQRNDVKLALAACRYRAKHDKYPDKPEELVPDFIPFAPVDPFDGKPMRLKRADEKLVIYSIGPDAIDDGGAPYDQTTGKGDIIFELPTHPN